MAIGDWYPGDEWPAGISDGLTLPCSVCGDVPAFDYLVTDDAWRLVVPSAFRRGVICLPCLDGLASELGIDISDKIVNVQWTGRGHTVVLTPTSVYRFHERRV